MQSLIFWRNWKPADKYLYLFSFATLCFVLGWYVVAYFIGNEAVISWEIVKDSQPIGSTLDSFEKYLLNFSVEADSYAITQTYQASPIAINQTANYLLLGAVVVGLLLLLTVSTYLSNTWFFALSVPVVLHFVTLKMELLGISQQTHQLPLLAVFLAYMPLAYYFQSWATHFSLRFRLGVFASITAVVGLVIAYLSKASFPAIFIANSGLVVPLGLSALFIAFNAHEIIRGLLWLVIQAGGGTSRSTHLHFIVISLIYLLNLLYACFYYIEGVDWGILFLEPLWVLPISIVLGVWGFARREVQYGNLLDFVPHGALLYNGLAIITLATAAYSFSSGNDSLRGVFEHLVLFTHVGFGAAFVLYTLSNFYPLLKQGKDIHKILYKPYRLDYLWVLLAGGLLTAAAVFYTNYEVYDKAQAAYYNGLGDAYLRQDNQRLSEFEYQHALDYDFSSQKANYALASLAQKQNDTKATLYHLQKCLNRTSSPFVYANVSELYLQQDQFFDALLKLREGLQKFPNSSELANNFALLFSRTDITDSTLFYFDKAKALADDPTIAEANFMYWLGKKAKTISPDSLKQLVANPNNLTTLSNELAWNNRMKQPFAKGLNPDMLQDTLLQPAAMCYLYNYTLNQVPTADTSMLSFIRFYKSKESNAQYFNFFYWAEAMKQRAMGNNHKAFKLFERAYKEGSDTDYEKPKQLGSFLYENEQFLLAAYYFSKAYFRGYAQGRVYEAFALSELADRKIALAIWEELRASKDMTTQLVAKNILKVLHPDSLKTLKISTLNDQQNYYFAHFNQEKISDSQFNELINLAKDADLRFLLVTERMKFFMTQNQWEAAENLRNAVTGLGTNKPDLLEQLRLLDLQLLTKLKRFGEVKKLATESKFKGVQQGYQPFYLAVAAENAGDTLQAEKLYQTALQQLPFDAEVVMTVAQHYNKRNRKQQAYNILVDNLHFYPEFRYYPVPVYELYILQALELNFTEYAESSLPQLFEISPKVRYDIFYKLYESRKKELAKVTEGWE